MAQVNKAVIGLPDFFAQYQGGNISLELVPSVAPVVDISQFIQPPQHKTIEIDHPTPSAQYNDVFEVPDNELWLVTDVGYEITRSSQINDLSHAWLIWQPGRHIPPSPIGERGQGLGLFADNDLRRWLAISVNFPTPFMLLPGQSIGAGLIVEISSGILTVPVRLTVRYQLVKV